MNNKRRELTVCTTTRGEISSNSSHDNLRIALSPANEIGITNVNNSSTTKNQLRNVVKSRNLRSSHPIQLVFHLEAN